jgi:hypothetical protein
MGRKMKNLGKIFGFLVALVVVLFVIVCKRQPLNPLDPNNPYTLGKDYICHAESIGIGRVKLSWDKIDQPQIKGYRIYRYKSDESPVAIADVDTNLFFDSQLLSGQTYVYYYRLIWEDSREIHKSPEDAVKTFDSPTGFTIKDVTRTRIELKWDDLGWLDNYSYCRIFRRQNGDFILYDSTSSSIEYIDTHVQENVTYRYKLIAVANDGATSNFTSDAYATPRNSVPRIDSIVPPNPVVSWGYSIIITCYAFDKEGDSIHYNWEALDGGEITGLGSSVVFTVPQDSLLIHRVKVMVSDNYGQGDVTTVNILSIQDTWITKASMPTARMMLGIGVVNNKIYAIGGGDLGITLTANEEYDPATNSWATKASMPTPRVWLGIGVANNKIYAIGGDNFGDLSTNEEYNPTTNYWTTRTPMPQARTFSRIGVVNGRIYAIGGRQGSTTLSRNEEYIPPY